MVDQVVGTGEVQILVIDHRQNDWGTWLHTLERLGVGIALTTDIQSGEKLLESHLDIKVIIVEVCAWSREGVASLSIDATSDFLGKLFPETGRRFPGMAYVPYETFEPSKWKDLKLIAPRQVILLVRAPFLDGKAVLRIAPLRILHPAS
jgi:hypothetical protein